MAVNKPVGDKARKGAVKKPAKKTTAAKKFRGVREEKNRSS